MEGQQPNQSIYVNDFMTEEEEEHTEESKQKDEISFKKRKENFNLEKILSEFVLKKAVFIQQRDGDIKTYYTFESKPVGEGAYGVVYKATELESGEIRAVKVLEKSKIK